MAITKPVCDICGTKESKTWMHQGVYKTCKICSHDIQLFESQPMKDYNLKMLLETFFRRGKGEDITFEEIHKEKSSFKLINFMDLYKQSD